MDVPEDDFKGFGEGFDGFPKRLPEDCVEYSLFIIDSRLKSQKELLGRLEDVRKESLQLTVSLLKEYIWQREAFKLELEGGKGLMYLHGLTNYGDSVEDEWLIVYILKELSTKFPDLWIKVVDTDGEFLLIEAANALPRWLNPEIADNRVWINKNRLRIIPLSAAPASSSAKATAPVSRPLSLEEAKETITSTPQILINSPLLEEEAFYRLRNYPSQITASLHHAPIAIPKKLAYLLHDRPASIAPAVEAFYLRDPVALRPLQSSSSTLVFPPADLVVVSTRFTKVLYAQLKSQQFTPPESWKDILFRSGKHAPSDHIGVKKHAQLELGMKVASGFEMLLTDPKNGDNRIVRELKILIEDLETDDDVTLPTDEEISKWKDVNREDDEIWLDINFEDFERELDGKNKSKKPAVPGTFGAEPPQGFGDAKTQADLKKMVERFEAFLNDDAAGIDGAEMDDMDIDDDEDDDDLDDSEDEDKDVSFDEKEFAKMMREMMGMPSEEDEEAAANLTKASSTGLGGSRIRELDSSDDGDDDDDDDDDDEDEASKLKKVMDQMEAELNEAGALNLNPIPSKLAALKGKSRAGKEEVQKATEDTDDEESDGEIDIDFNLAKNLLESFKSQAGMAGPGGNLMGMMGMQLPRDEDDAEPGMNKN